MSRGRVAIFAAVLFSVAFLLSPYSPINLSDPQPTFPQYTQEYQYPLEPHAHVLNQTQPKRVAIIGAGASGTSAAWFLTRAGSVMEQRMGLAKGSLLGEVVVYDREGHVGGRTTTVFPHGDERLRPIELGASIFVSANRHLVKGAKRFGLKTIDPDFGESGVGIWDGKEFLYQTSTSKSRYSNWYDSLTALRRYGPLSPFRTQKAISALLVKFANLYNPEWLNQRGAAKNIEEFAERVGLGREYTTRRGDEWATGAVGVNKQWAGEVWDSSTRVNYGSDMNQIHALGAAVSLATSGAQAVEGGNFRIFEGMMDESKATLRLGTEVLDIKPIHRSGDPPSFTVITNSSEASTGPFNQIFYASPWYSSPKDKGMRGLQSNLIEPIHYTKYVRLHVTLLTTTRAAPLPSFFGLPDTAVVPSTILTTSYTSHTKAATPPPKFQSITWHGETYEGSGEHVVKIFSLHYLNQEFLTDLIGEEPGWLLRKEWDSYPELRPVSSFPPIEPVKGVQYLGALEPWVSTMETQTLSAREAVARVVQDWWGLGYGECRGGADAWDWSCEE